MDINVCACFVRQAWLLWDFPDLGAPPGWRLTTIELPAQDDLDDDESDSVNTIGLGSAGGGMLCGGGGGSRPADAANPFDF